MLSGFRLASSYRQEGLTSSEKLEVAENMDLTFRVTPVFCSFLFLLLYAFI